MTKLNKECNIYIIVSMYVRIRCQRTIYPVQTKKELVLQTNMGTEIYIICPSKNQSILTFSGIRTGQKDRNIDKSFTSHHSTLVSGFYIITQSIKATSCNNKSGFPSILIEFYSIRKVLMGFRWRFIHHIVPAIQNYKGS